MSELSKLSQNDFVQNFIPKLNQELKYAIQQHRYLLKSMQLQIQNGTHLFSKKAPTQQLNVKEKQFASFFEIKKVYPSKDLLSQLRQIQLTAKAHYFYLSSLRKKAFKGFYEHDSQVELAMMQKSFFGFKYLILESRINHRHKEKLFQTLQNIVQTTKLKAQRMKKAKTHYQTSLKKNIFGEFSSFVKINQKSNNLNNYLFKQRVKQFTLKLKQNIHKSKYNRLKKQQTQYEVDSINAKFLFKKYFNLIKTFSKENKLLKSRKSIVFKRFVKKLIEDKRQNEQIVQNFKFQRQTRLKINIFEAFKESKRISQCFQWHKYKILKKYFKNWIQNHQIQQNQKQIEESNQVILQHYFQSKGPIVQQKIKQKYFNFWKSWLILQKQNKKQNELIQSFAQLRQRQFLQRKFFQILKLNKNISKSERFHEKNLAKKSLASFRKNQVNQIEKSRNVRNFILNRSIRKYFYAIQQFIKKDKMKVNAFLLNKYWTYFTMNIAAQYFEKCEKAKNYYSTLLKFKTMIGLKQSVELNKKACFCAFLINLALPFKRWSLRFRVRKWTQAQQYAKMKKIFFEWKLLSIRKSMKRQEIPDTSQLFIQSMITAKNSKENLSSKLNLPSKQKLKSNINQILQTSQEEISFFKKMNEKQQSESEQDEIDKKVNQLLNKIKTQRRQVRKQQPQQSKSALSFTNEKLLIFNSKTQLSSGLKTQKTSQKLRLPTWSSADRDYKVSVFVDEEDD